MVSPGSVSVGDLAPATLLAFVCAQRVHRARIWWAAGAQEEALEQLGAV